MTQIAKQGLKGMLAFSALTAGLILGTFTGSRDAQAYSNPLIRNCVINGGIFHVEPYLGDDMALCRWDLTMIDSQSILSSINGLISEAASVILSEVTSSDCQTVAGTDYMMKEGQTLCVFGDGSMLSLAAVKAGSQDPNRLHLKSVLSTR